MPSSSIADNVVTSDLVLKLGGNAVQKRWIQYDVDSDLMRPADDWHVLVGLQDEILPDGVQAGAKATLEVDGQVVLTGSADVVEDDLSKGKRTLALTGRDGAAVLMDCSAPIFTATQQTLDQILAKIVRPLGVRNIRVDADTKLLRERVSTEPGDSAWSALQRAAEANGLWPWFAPDGTLIVGGPDYTAEPIVRLFLMTDGRSNVTRIRIKHNVAERFSEVTVLGQAHSGISSGTGQHNIKATVLDTGVLGYRPKIICDFEAQTKEIATARGRKFISDARLKGFELVVEVPGHRAIGTTLWTPGQRVRITSEPQDIDAVFFLMKRRFLMDKAKGQRTELHFKEDQVWVLDAHPHKRKHRRGQNSTPGKIVDLTGAH